MATRHAHQSHDKVEGRGAASSGSQGHAPSSSSDPHNGSEQHQQQANPSGSDEAGEEARPRTKRKKASRACFHCQKAHLTCDDETNPEARPCQRCVKRGLGGTCQDGVRKKAKYLQDVDATHVHAPAKQTTRPDLIKSESLNTNYSTLQGSFDASTPGDSSDYGAPLSNAGTVNMAAVQPQTNPNGSGEVGNYSYNFLDDNLLFEYPPLSTYDFDSKTANLEYSMISTMLGNEFQTPGTDQPSPDHFAFPSPHESIAARRRMSGTPDSRLTSEPPGQTQAAAWQNGQQQQQQQAYMPPFNGFPLINPTSPHTSHLESQSNMVPLPMLNGQSANAPQQTPALGNGNGNGNASAKIAQGTVDPHGQRPTPVARRPVQCRPGLNPSDPSTIYKSVTKPFHYTAGYHLLNAYLRGRFGKSDLLRIARAIVGYRPSFIALTKTLREEDLTFMEICFQRTMLEYEKFVGYSGTPTVIWRRTGQIELVGKEFCLLTGWSRDALLAKQTFIVELMDDSSVVEYFERFSEHAFADTSSVQTTCVLLTPQKRPVPCAFCFTIKRDVFDIPMVIVGNFLPVL